MENLVDWGASSFVVESADQDIIKGLIGDKRSLNTKREYEKDLLDFFATMTRQPAANDVVKSFLGLNRGQALATVLKYKAQLIEKGLKEATVNRRLAALRSLANYYSGGLISINPPKRTGVFSVKDVQRTRLPIFNGRSNAPGKPVSANGI